MLVLDGRGEAVSHLAGRYAADGSLTVLARQALPHSLGLLYEDVTEHLGFLRSSDEYKVMALASYGTPRHLPVLREAVRATGDGGFRTDPVDWDALAKRRARGRGVGPPSTPTWPPACRRGWRRCCSSWPAGCTSRPATGC